MLLISSTRVQVRRQVAGMRILSIAPGERSFVAEAAATASCRALLGPLACDAALRAAFVAADGPSALRELLDNPSDRVRRCGRWPVGGPRGPSQVL